MSKPSKMLRHEAGLDFACESPVSHQHGNRRTAAMPFGVKENLGAAPQIPNRYVVAQSCGGVCVGPSLGE